VSKLIAEEGHSVPSFRLLLLIPLVLAAVLLPGSGQAADPTVLKGNVGPGFSITLRDANNKPVTRVLPGDYTIVVTDQSDLHNFHFSGPGVDMRTESETAGTQTWNVTLVDGKYTYKCDVHPTTMKGTLNVGVAPPPPPPPTKLNGRVGPKKTISLKTASGGTVKTLKSGSFKILVKDMTKTDNFHLLGPGVNRKTPVKAKATATWTLKLKPGKYSVRSDAHKTLLRKFSVRAAPTT
jgi:hypothetical protein